MPSRPLKPCNHPRCPNLTKDRFCEAHSKQERQRADKQRGTSTQRGYGSRWAKIRKLFIRDPDNALCYDCLNKIPQKLTPTEEVHHIVALRDGGTHEFTNLLGLCKSCHSIRTVNENGGFGNKKAHTER